MIIGISNKTRYRVSVLPASVEDEVADVVGTLDERDLLHIVSWTAVPLISTVKPCAHLVKFKKMSTSQCSNLYMYT